MFRLSKAAIKTKNVCIILTWKFMETQFLHFHAGFISHALGFPPEIQIICYTGEAAQVYSV